MNINLSAIEGIREVEDGYLLGTIHIMDVPHHVALIAVVEENGEQLAAGPSEIVENMLADIQHFEEAQAYVSDLYARWTLVRSTRVVASDDAVNAVWSDGRLHSRVKGE